ncbi:hypothetical protein [Mesorhizobium sp.]|uniref:hypothetical protein n=1 Tax=Mesorhizobium sp. TaxID=1871066 RepID=UPI000FE481F8|nr:hypothetical protein [Mesorhizobium sp.]RWI35549.1 MAG: hypothetical protein EOR14_29030 [Mesorhizobium sp.]RWJ66444.1 MAG: hypothetical protein EOR34_28940 [Mesorhizobium sp.]
MTDTFTITHLSYDESCDVLVVEAYQSAHDGELYTQAEAEIKIEIQHRFCASSAIKLTHDVYREHDATFLPTVLLAFACAFQEAHDEQNPGDSPGLTQLASFDVDYTGPTFARLPTTYDYDANDLAPEEVFAKLSALKEA